MGWGTDPVVDDTKKPAGGWGQDPIVEEPPPTVVRDGVKTFGPEKTDDHESDDFFSSARKFGRAAGREAGDVASFGVSEYLGKKARGLLARVKGEDVDAAEAGVEKRRQQDMAASPGGKITGAVAGSFAPTGIANKIIGGGKTLKAVVASNALGAALREGLHIDDRDLEQRAEDAGLSALIEGGVGAVGHGVGKAVSWVGKKATDAMRGLEYDAGKQVSSELGRHAEKFKDMDNAIRNVRIQNVLQRLEQFLPNQGAAAAGDAQLGKIAGDVPARLEQGADNMLKYHERAMNAVKPNSGQIIDNFMSNANKIARGNIGKGAMGLGAGVVAAGAGPYGAVVGIPSAGFAARSIYKAVMSSPEILDQLMKLGPAGASLGRAAKMGATAFGAALVTLRAKDPQAYQQVVQAIPAPAQL